jgi:hypothetical protein
LLSLGYQTSQGGDSMKRILSVTLIGAMMLSAARCNPFAPDQTVELGVAQLEAPPTVASGTPFNVVLTVQLGGCLSYDRIDAVRSETSVSFTVWGKDASKGRSDTMCPQNIVYEPHSYSVKPPFSGPFDISVNRGRLSPLTATVKVE